MSGANSSQFACGDLPAGPEVDRRQPHLAPGRRGHVSASDDVAHSIRPLRRRPAAVQLDDRPGRLRRGAVGVGDLGPAAVVGRPVGRVLRLGGPRRALQVAAHGRLVGRHRLAGRVLPEDAHRGGRAAAPRRRGPCGRRESGSACRRSTGNVFCHQPCSPSRSSAAMTSAPFPFGPPFGSNENAGRISSRGAAGSQPAGAAIRYSQCADGSAIPNGTTITRPRMKRQYEYPHGDRSMIPRMRPRWNCFIDKPPLPVSRDAQALRSASAGGRSGLLMRP